MISLITTADSDKDNKQKIYCKKYNPLKNIGIGGNNTESSKTKKWIRYNFSKETYKEIY